MRCWLCLILILTACGSPDEDTGCVDSGDWTPDFVYDEQTCDHIGLDEGSWSQGAVYDESQGEEGPDSVQSWTLRSAADTLVCRWWSPEDALPGELALASSLDESEPVFCFLKDDKGWDDEAQASSYRARFIAVVGSVSLIEGGDGAQRLEGALDQVLLLQEETDGDVRSLVPHGERWCLPEVSIDSELEIYD